MALVSKMPVVSEISFSGFGKPFREGDVRDRLPMMGSRSAPWLSVSDTTISSALTRETQVERSVSEPASINSGFQVPMCPTSGSHSRCSPARV